MKIIVKNLLIAFAVLILISAVFSLFAINTTKEKKITLSQLVEQINEGLVNKITVKDSELEITLSSGEKEISQKEQDISLSESLKNYGAKDEELKKIDIEIKKAGNGSFWIGTILSIILPFLLIAGFFWLTFRQVQKGNMQAFSFGKSKARIATQKEKITFTDVAGLLEPKEELKEIVEFLRDPKKFLIMGARIPRGVLLMGPPGTGKTLLARAVAGEANVPFFHISGSEFVEMFVGVGASRVRDLFETAKKAAPSILFIDEIDAVGRHRGAGLGGGHDEREQTLNQILTEMDGFDRDTNVIVIAATNRPDILDPALLRPGRFDRRVVLDSPDIKDREAILKIHAKEKPLGQDVNLNQIAQRTPGFSGADLANLMNEAAIFAARKNKKTINQIELIDSIEKVMLGPERKSHILSAKEKEIAAYHEAGHALVGAMLKNSDPVHKVSIISRGQAAGYTLKVPSEDQHFRSKSQFIADLAVALGGYVAEKLIFNELTTGASNDLQKAAELARKLVTKYGMSDKLGPVVFGDHSDLVFLGKEITEQKNYSEKVAAQIDDEVSKLIRDAEKTAEKIIKSKKVKLDLIAKKLIEKETIEKEEFDKIIKEA